MNSGLGKKSAAFLRATERAARADALSIFIVTMGSELPLRVIQL
jgi:hypothetical protein